ncbi:unnamed protein product, partial [Prorocentrum cordatum]
AVAAAVQTYHQQLSQDGPSGSGGPYQQSPTTTTTIMTGPTTTGTVSEPLPTIPEQVDETWEVLSDA